MSQLKPRQPAPALTVSTVGHGTFELSKQKPDSFTLLVVYRGLHCPVCRGYIKKLAELVPEFDRRGTTVLALSVNDEATARQTVEQWELEGLQLGYGLSLDTARAWGLFISGAKPGSQEPDHFTEPGVFLVRPDGSLYAAVINSMPFARPHLKDILSAVDFINEKNYPARGEA